MNEFNNRQLPDQYVEEGWSLLLPREHYQESLPDDRPFERPFQNTEKALRKHLIEKTGVDLVEYFINEQIYFKRGFGANAPQLETWVREHAESFPGVLSIVSLRNFEQCAAEAG